jgi:drug/metabolite transporter (DMT)-like permease
MILRLALDGTPCLLLSGAIMPGRGGAEGVLFACTAIWGSTFAVTKNALDTSSPLLFVAARFALATLLLAPWVLKDLRRMTSRALGRGLWLGVLLFAGFATQTVGLRYTTASKSGFITGMLVVLTPIFQLVLERRAPRLGNLAGVGLVTLGLYLLTSPEGSAFNVGDALTLACAVAYALFIVFLDIFTKEHDPSQLTFVELAATSLLAVASAPFLEDLRFSLDGETLGAIAYLALFATLGALYLQARYQRETTPTRAALIFSLEPVFAALFAYLLRGERLGALGIVGGSVIVAGVLLSELWEVLSCRCRRAP